MSGQYAAEIEHAHRLAATGQVAAAVESLAALSRSAPDDLDLLFALGVVARSAGLLDEAEQAYRTVIGKRPSAVEAAVNLAGVLVAKGTPAPAITILTRIHQLAPGLVPAALGLGAALFAANDPLAALAVYERVLAERPDHAEAHANRAEALFRLGRYPEALEAVERAHSLAPDDPRIGLNRAFALLIDGRLDEGFAAYEARLAASLPDAPIREGLDLPRWSGGPLPDGPLLVAAEQGLGDEIRFTAAAAALAATGQALVIEAEPRLVPLFRRSLPGAVVEPYDRRRSGVRPVFGYRWLTQLAEPPVAWIEAGSLPLRLGPPRDRAFAPNGYLTVDRDRVEALRLPAPAGSVAPPTVGIVWGSAGTDARRRRFYPPAEAWGPILTLPGMRFVDMQYVESADDRAMFRDRFGVAIEPVDSIDKRNDLDGLAALSAGLDAVIGVSSSVTALAGAVGTPAIEVLGERVWLPRVDGRDGWLGPIRLVEADPPGSWDATMERAAALLAETVSRRRPRVASG